MSLLILCAFLSLVIPAMLLVACAMNRLRFLRTCSLIVRAVDPIAAWSIALMFAVFCQTLVPIAAVRGHNFGVPFLPTQLPSLVAWYKQQGVTTGYNGAASLVAATPSFFVLNSVWWVSNFPFTISVWVNPTSISGNQCIFDQFATGSDRLVVYLDNSGKINIGVNNYAAVLTSTATISAGVWSHIVCTYDGTTAQIIINNGTPRTGALQSITGTPVNGWWGHSNSAGGWTGLLDEGKVFSRVWSAGEITADYASGNGVSTFPGDLAAAGISTSNYVAGYAFNGSGNLVHDYSGNGNTLLNTNSVTYTQGKVLTNNFIAGDGGGVTNTLGNQTTDGAASFASASSQYLSSATGPVTGAPFTLSFWSNVTTSGNFYGLMSLDTSGNFRLRVTSAENLEFTTNTGTNTITSSGTIGVGSWSHVVVTWDGSTVNFYINGSKDANSGSYSSTGSSFNGLAIGARSTGGGNDLNGSMDEVKVFSRVWSQAEVTADYASGNGVSANPADLTAAGISLTGYAAGYTFNGPGANLLADRSGNSNTLTNNNTVTFAAGQVSSFVLADLDAVSKWSDQSGNGNHLVQATAANRPVYKVAIQNGRPVVRFNGTTQYMSTSLTPFGGAFTVFGVAAPNQTNSEGLLLCGSAAGGSNFGVGIYSTGKMEGVKSNATGYHTNTAYSAAWGMLAWWGLGGAAFTLNTSYNNANSDTNASPSGLASATQSFLGASGNAAQVAQQFWNGDMGEIVICEAVLTTPQQTQFYNYQRSLWATP